MKKTTEQLLCVHPIDEISRLLLCPSNKQQYNTWANYFKTMWTQAKTIGTLHGMRRSRVELEVKSLGVVVLRAFLVQAPAVHAAAEVAFVHPVLTTQPDH